MSHIIIIAGDKDKDDFMHKLDVFESFKHLGNSTKVVLSEGAIITNDEILKLKEICENKGMFVTAIIYSADPSISYINWDVIVVSDGDRWFLLADYLNQYGITKE